MSRTPTLRITRIEVFDARRRFDRPAWNAGWRWQERRVPLLRLTTADGMQGLGEAWVGATGFEALPGPLRARAEWLLGRELDDAFCPGDPGPDWTTAAVNSAFDMAAWDVRARREDQPLHRLLNGAATVCAYASGGLYEHGKTPDALAAEMAGYAAQGFRTIKLKIGALSMEQDIARVAAVRAALGPERTILVDAVGQLTRATAPAWTHALAALGVRHIQAPLPDADLDGMVALQAAGPLQLIGQEREHRPAAFATLLRRRAVGLLQFCPGLVGGITGSLRLLALARAANIPATLQCFSTAIMQSACLHLAGQPGVQSAEYHQFHDTLHSNLPAAMRAVQDGTVHLASEPGLGLNPALLDTPADPVRITRMFG